LGELRGMHASKTFAAGNREEIKRIRTPNCGALEVNHENNCAD